MSYLVFIISVGLFALFGSGGPLHRDRWFHSLNDRVDALELDIWPSLLLRVLAPVLALWLFLALLDLFFGALATGLAGVVVLYVAWGRGDYPTDIERFLARARVGDLEGADMLLNERARESEQDEADGSAGMRDFAYRGYSRWFPSVLYYLMLGPLAAITYRLVYLANERSDGRFETAMRMLDWLPARLLLVTFSVLGDFEHTRRALTTEAFDQTISTDALLALGIERAWRVETEGQDEAESTVVAVEATQKAINLSTAVWVAVVSVIALF